MIARLAVGDGALAIDLARPIELAIPLDFAGAQPRHFGAPPAQSRPFVSGVFEGEVARGGSCNCRTITLTPHCNGTHTECVGHLTRESVDAFRIAPREPTLALLLSVEPEPASGTEETSEPTPRSGDQLITRHALLAAWPYAATRMPGTPAALVVRTLPNDPAKRTRDYSGQVPPYFSREAAAELVSRGIEHIVVDIPSLDRTHDEGRLAVHRLFFGLPAGSTCLTDARRARCTVTELAFVPDEAPDGIYVLALHLPALAGDAVPSRPLLYPPLP